MKTYKILALGFLISATAVACSPTQRELTHSVGPISGNKPSGLDLQKIERNYLTCLASGNPGVVESALGHVIYMRIAFPNEDLREIQTRLFDLASRGSTRAIRYKAYVALHVFADPRAFRMALESKNIENDEFFTDLVSHLQ